MKGLSSFSSAEADAIRACLRELRNADRLEQKTLRDTLRKTYRFYITDFDISGKGFTEADFNALVRSGRVTIGEID